MGELTYQTFEEMYLENYKMVFDYIRRSIWYKNFDVEDLTQEVFKVAYEKWETVQYYSNIPGFLIGVAHNKIKKWFDRKKMLYVDEAEFLDALEFARTYQDKLEQVEMDVTMKEIVAEDDMNILKQYYLYGYTAAEIAESMQLSESCVKMRAARAKEKIRRQIRSFFGTVVILGSFSWLNGWWI
ncbi:MAG: sigma-70 family RNA polymerase sigma factor [Lachnospiraceae bacterium]|nr:sigma-70 family RNA polymerase sigma factor [Lachnospiraceae bacterium]